MDNCSRRGFLVSSTLGLLGTLTLGRSVLAQSSRERTLYVGTYTSGESEGIYIYRMNSNTGELRRVNAVKSVNPSFLSIDQSRRYLYAVNEVAEFGGQTSGAVSAFAIEPGHTNLKFLNQEPSMGADPCHLTITRNGKFLLVANYTGGNISVLPIARDGSLKAAADVAQHQGSSIKDQQKGPHAHCIILDRNERHALAADLGIDKIMIYDFNRATGKLEPSKDISSQLPAGAGPRHLTLHPNGSYAYVINELDSTMSTFKYNHRSGSLQLVQTISTLPQTFSGTSYCADVHVSPSGRFVYGSNRGHNSIVVFSVAQRTGQLRPLEYVSTQGNWPRNFVIDPSGQFLLVANQRTDNVVVFRVDPVTGRLKPTGHNEKIPTPVCLKFI